MIAQTDSISPTAQLSVYTSLAAIPFASWAIWRTCKGFSMSQKDEFTTFLHSNPSPDVLPLCLSLWARIARNDLQKELTKPNAFTLFEYAQQYYILCIKTNNSIWTFKSYSYNQEEVNSLDKRCLELLFKNYVFMGCGETQEKKRKQMIRPSFLEYSLTLLNNSLKSETER